MTPNSGYLAHRPYNEKMEYSIIIILLIILNSIKLPHQHDVLHCTDFITNKITSTQ